MRLESSADRLTGIERTSFPKCFYIFTIWIPGQCREFIKTIPEDGSRVEWGPVFLHARPVSTPKQQLSASGISEASTTTGNATGASGENFGTINNSGTAFTNDQLHRGGFQA